MDTRQLAVRRVEQARHESRGAYCAGCALFSGVVAFILYLQQQPSHAPVSIVEHVRPLRPVGTLSLPASPAAAVRGGSVAGGGGRPQEHESMQPMAVLNRERARVSGQLSGLFKVYRPAPLLRPGGSLDVPETLERAVQGSAADGEVMLLCVGGSGSMRAGMNLIYNFRAMGLYHMLILASEAQVCESLWESLPSLACVHWPSRFARPRPPSLYNTMFKGTALLFFEARKLLLEKLVVQHQLNVLHLDADTVWFANPYPIFKSLYKDYSLIIQTDNPFVNAGIMYIQNVRAGDAGAWVLEELNRRIERFTYTPESVRELPHSGWSTPPHFANADEQANLNDIITSALNGEQTYASGVEFYEARFKRDKGSAAARQKMSNGRWVHATQQGDVLPARKHLVGLSPDSRYEKLVHLCKMGLFGSVQTAQLRVPHNATAAPSGLLLAPEWLFSHFPYGAFFPSFRKCHDDSWEWQKASVLEQRLCMPTFRVPVVMVHMAGLRNGQWGRRGVMRALGVWHEEADKVAKDSWLSLDTPKLLLTEGMSSRFASMKEFDHFAARLILLGMLLGRRVVIPPMPCHKQWTQAAMEPRHLRGIEVGCGPHKQCAWIPFPHFKEAWCSGVDFIYDIDFREMQQNGKVSDADISTLHASDLRLGASATIETISGAALPTARVLRIDAPSNGRNDPFEWIPLDGFRSRAGWKNSDSFPRHVLTALEAIKGFGPTQTTIFKDCMHSLATSND